MIPDRRPPVRMESRDERVTVRLTPTQRAMFEDAARQIGEELSRYIRSCAVMGHTVKQAQSVLKAAGA